MLEVIIPAIYRFLMNVYSGCLNFCYGSCASLYTIDVSRDWIVKNILEINGTVPKTVKTIKILRTNVQDTSAVYSLKWLNKVLKCHDDAITPWNAFKHNRRLQRSHSDYLGWMGRRIGTWGPFLETNFALLLMLFICSLSRNYFLAWTSLRCHERWGGVLGMGCLHNSSTHAPYCDRGSLVIH